MTTDVMHESTLQRLVMGFDNDERLADSSLGAVHVTTLHSNDNSYIDAARQG